MLILLLLDKFGLNEFPDSSSIRDIRTLPDLLILSFLDIYFWFHYGYHYGKGLSSQSAEIPSRMSLSPFSTILMESYWWSSLVSFDDQIGSGIRRILDAYDDEIEGTRRRSSIKLSKGTEE